MPFRFARVCPEHGALLREGLAGLICPHRRHHVGRWLVVDLGRGKVLGAGSAGRVVLGPVLAALLVELGQPHERRYALPKPAHPAAA